jgi:hypothetical protein
MLSGAHGFSFYTEYEWSQYGYEPPEGYDVIGAWRHPRSEAYVFLLSEHGKIESRASRRLLLTMVGTRSHIDSLKELITSLKLRYDNTNEKEVRQIETNRRLERANITGIQ